jgi:hypothetical protein
VLCAGELYVLYQLCSSVVSDVLNHIPSMATLLSHSQAGSGQFVAD